MRCRLGLHDWKYWYSGWDAPDAVTYCLSKCYRCGHVRSTAWASTAVAKLRSLGVAL